MERLVAFLLDRIAEDRAALSWLDSQFGNAQRWVDECDVRRRIVEFVAPNPDGVDSLEGCDVLLMMALPYAEHPDYQPQWRR